MKQVLSVFAGIFLLLLCIALINWCKSYLQEDFYYSVPEPKIYGMFQAQKNSPFITINGIEKIIGEETAGLVYGELVCDLQSNHCEETRFTILNIMGVSIFPDVNKYKIKYKDKNRIILESSNGRVSGEIDLKMQTLFYSTTSLFDKTPRKIEVITNNQEIDKLKKHIIRKHLRRGIKR